MASMLPHLFSVFLLLLPISTSAQSSGNITPGSSLTASDKNSFWASPSGEFAFGFYPLDEDMFLPSIWFAKIPVKTIVWTANNGNPVQKGAKYELTTSGVLILNDHKGEEIWRNTNNGTHASYASMLDTGNFLLSNNGFDIWTSFDNPTDTILPTQKLGLGGTLASRLTKEDFSIGRFELRLQKDQNLVFYTISRPTDGTYSSYWTSNTLGNGTELVYNQSGYIYLSLNNGSLLELNLEKPNSTRDFYHRATLDFDGVLREYTYPKTSQSNGKWPQSWSISWSLPQDICQAVKTRLGSGVCGYNSYCTLEDGLPNCVCPPGYVYNDPNNTFEGCKQNFVPQNCLNDGSNATNEFVMRAIVGVDWPDSEFEFFQDVEEDWCSQSCLNDCLCMVAIFRSQWCWKKRFPLSNGKMSPGGKAFIKLPNTDTSLKPDFLPKLEGDKKDRSHLILPGSILLGSSVFLNLILLLVTIMAFRGKKLQKIKPNTSNLEINLPSFTYKELEEATNGFKEELGRGALSTVYKGVLRSDSRRIVAVKRLDMVMRERDKEFRAEVSAISMANHKNLIKLVGFCDEGSHRLLVYEYMRNGSLADFLFGNSRPEWSQRTQIVLGIARGLTYLHEECSSKIIHCDVKPQNILLDDSFSARISDFGLAKLLKIDQTRTLTGIRGTRGYLAPEWLRNMPITAKVDVYSFGVVLLNIISCRRSVQSQVGDEDQEILAYWSYDCYKEGRLNLIVGSDEEAIKDGRRLERFVMVAFWCIQEDPSQRPSMKEVSQMLEGTVEVSAPPNPSSFRDSTC